MKSQFRISHGSPRREKWVTHQSSVRAGKGTGETKEKGARIFRPELHLQQTVSLFAAIHRAAIIAAIRGAVALAAIALAAVTALVGAASRATCLSRDGRTLGQSADSQYSRN